MAHTVDTWTRVSAAKQNANRLYMELALKADRVKAAWYREESPARRELLIKAHAILAKRAGHFQSTRNSLAQALALIEAGYTLRWLAPRRWVIVNPNPDDNSTALRIALGELAGDIAQAMDALTTDQDGAPLSERELRATA